MLPGDKQEQHQVYTTFIRYAYPTLFGIESLLSASVFSDLLLKSLYVAGQPDVILLQPLLILEHCLPVLICLRLSYTDMNNKEYLVLQHSVSPAVPPIESCRKHLTTVRTIINLNIFSLFLTQYHPEDEV